MAANYWSSSQRLHWQMSREKLAEIRHNLDAQDEKAVQAYPLPSYRQLSIFFNSRTACPSQLIRLGRRMQVRQQALATAQLYVRRFYTKVPIRDTNPFLVMATCLYLALKMEECPQHIRIVVSEARSCFSDIMPAYPEKLAECEFYVISELNSYLIVHHPYRTLQELTPILNLTSEDNSTSWQVINDSCVTDLPLIYPPHIIALTAIFLSVVLKSSPSQTSLHTTAAAAAAAAAAVATNPVANVPAIPANTGGDFNGGGASTNLSGNGQGQQQNRVGRLIEWYAESKVDMEAIIDCTQEIISLYEVWESLPPQAEKVFKEQLCKMVKQRGIS
ncbi:cyclin-like protein [Sphaerosporella brunnea]|uniref:RNA polymerase II holoenzyme cyclin-like subunit n=1 Tax=Sphaerosporella brunnea TaxID=1250544 RepID=A0A5J5EJ11_9PEZI|nr:cyclin-like protein [Sphaerosporella brunnea]KAA8895077.1 cyclin-like protein [Sphaerosporella brunnea]